MLSLHCNSLSSSLAGSTWEIAELLRFRDKRLHVICLSWIQYPGGHNRELEINFSDGSQIGKDWINLIIQPAKI